MKKKTMNIEHRFAIPNNVNFLNGLFDDVNVVLKEHGIEFRIDDSSTYRVLSVNVPEIPKKFTKEETVDAVKNYAFHISDNGDPDEDASEWFDRRYK